MNSFYNLQSKQTHSTKKLQFYKTQMYMQEIKIENEIVLLLKIDLNIFGFKTHECLNFPQFSSYVYDFVKTLLKNSK